MLKLIGSVMVFGSCAALGLSARQNLRRRVAAADAMLLALGLIRSEISGRRTPMPEIVGLLTENEQLIVRKVFRTLQRRLREQNGLSLGYLWRSTLRDCRAQVGLGTQECDILCDAANYLGRYDADEQLTGLSQVERRLAAAKRFSSHLEEVEYYDAGGTATGWGFAAYVGGELVESCTTMRVNPSPDDRKGTATAFALAACVGGILTEYGTTEQKEEALWPGSE